jgi:hypothetical protein
MLNYMDIRNPKGAGRKPRPGEWSKLTVRLPRDVAEWLRAQPEPQGDVIAKGLELLRERPEAQK